MSIKKSSNIFSYEDKKFGSFSRKWIVKEIGCDILRMKSINLRTLIDLPVKLFKLLAIDFNSLNSASFTWRNVLAWINIFDLIIYSICSNTFFFLDEVLEMGKAVFGISIGATLLMVMVRYYVIYRHQSGIREIIDSLSRTFTKQEIESDDIKWYFQFFQRYTKYYSRIMFTSMFFFCLEPLKTFITTGKRILAFIVMFPFDATQLMYYPFIMTWLFFCHLMYVLGSVANEVLLYGIITVLSMEFKLLRVKIAAIDEAKDEEIPKRLKEAIERHSQLLDISAKLETIFSPTFFCNFVLSSIVICFTAFQASITTEIGELIFLLIFCSVILVQISVQCFFGELLKDCSSAIATSVYNCKWDSFLTDSSKKTLCMFLLRAQKPATFTAMNFSEVNLEQLAAVSQKVVKKY
jgi:hypothetical protein